MFVNLDPENRQLCKCKNNQIKNSRPLLNKICALVIKLAEGYLDDYTVKFNRTIYRYI